ncbi:hypothetical protein [Intestinibacillus massiliensis]|uniref:hypothetical protein n=1 Tax=Intestinibacillus massiliensis TaxID=1871029 RepID=UPI000B35F510|nr:hypothetical protein [Intestinibacillus massiliensis]
MEALALWWQGISGIEQAFLCVAIPATVLLLLQTVLLLFGLAGGGGDATEFDQPDLPGDSPDLDISLPYDPDVPEDFSLDPGTGLASDAPDGDMPAEHDVSGVRLFTVRGFVAFFAVGGWLGVAVLDAGAPAPLAVLLAFAGGAAALVAVAFLLKWSLKLQENGTLQLREAIAHTGTVYIPIPPARTGTGKVTLTLQSQFLELDAMTDNETALPTGAAVQVVGLFSGNILLVRPLSL